MSHEKLFTLYRENRLSLYKGKFLFSIIAFTVAVIILFILFHVSYVNSQERIVSIHQNFCKDIAGRLESLTVENDSTVVLDKVISDLIAENQKTLYLCWSCNITNYKAISQYYLFGQAY